jgi:hypothetical protein
MEVEKAKKARVYLELAQKAIPQTWGGFRQRLKPPEQLPSTARLKPRLFKEDFGSIRHDWFSREQWRAVPAD